MAQTDAVRRTLDQARDIGADKALLGADADNAQHRGQRRKVVVRDLGARGRNNADERRFADVRETDQADVRDDLQFQLEVHILAGQAGLGELGDLAGRGGKVAVAPAAAATLGHDHRFGAGQVRHDKVGLGLLQHSTAGHADDQVVAVGTAHALSAAILAVGRGVLALVAEVHQGRQVVVRHKDDITAAAAVAAVRTARRHEFFAVERHRTVAALAGVQPDRGGINKITGCHKIPLYYKKRASREGPPVPVLLLLDRAALAVTAHALKVNAAIDQSEQGVIAADADALTRMDMGAALTDQDVAGQNELTVAALDAEALGLGITTVLGRTYAFFMCHCDLPP